MFAHFVLSMLVSVVTTYWCLYSQLHVYINNLYCDIYHPTCVVPCGLHLMDKILILSIFCYVQPMLCVSAVNPFLLSKVKVLLHVVSTRRKIRALLDYVHCPFRGSIYKGLGSRRYLIESTDFFSLKNLIDLSRGAFAGKSSFPSAFFFLGLSDYVGSFSLFTHPLFAALPTILETIMKKIQEHITEQCLVCCDVGVPCGARQSCDDISSLIFPFQVKIPAQLVSTLENRNHRFHVDFNGYSVFSAQIQYNMFDLFHGCPKIIALFTVLI